MIMDVTIEFEDGSLYRCREDEGVEDLVEGEEGDSPWVPGVWTSPFPNTVEDHQAYGFLELFGQSSDSPLYKLVEVHGDPVKVTMAEVPETKEGVYRFYRDCGRYGILEGVFIAEEEEVDSLNGVDVYFGEIFGAGAGEISGEIELLEIVLLSDDPYFVSIFKANDLSSGVNPLDYRPSPEFMDSDRH